MREITIVGGLQIVFVVLGWSALGVVLKFNVYPDDNPFVLWTPLAAWLSEHGVWLLFVSPVWSGAAIVLHHRMDDRHVLNAVMTVTGTVLGFGFFACFLLAAFVPYTRPLLINVP